MSLWIALLLVAVLGFALFARWYTNQIVSREGMSQSVSGRASQIGALLTRGFFRKMKLRFRQLVASREARAELEKQYHVKSAEEAAKMMGQMKGVFMKIGQIISFTNESLPPEARQALAGLQSAAPPMDYSLVSQVIEQELGKPAEEIFKWIDSEPLAAASIGQVHRAKLKDGTDVVLKVQYPGVDEAIRSDLKASGGLVNMIGAVNKNIDAAALVEELKEIITQELDYTQELRSQKLFHDLWKSHPLIHVPAVYPEYSSQRVLCQEFRRGLSFKDFLDQSTEKERRLAVRVLHDFVFDSMNRFCVFNGDPHPGNYLFHEDGSITFLDYGCIKYFEPDFINDLTEMTRCMRDGDKAGFETMCKKLELVLPGRDYDIDHLWNFMSYNAEPQLTDKPFKFTKEWIQQAGEMMQQRDKMWNMNLPKDMIFFNRITFGLNSI